MRRENGKSLLPLLYTPYPLGERMSTEIPEPGLRLFGAPQRALIGLNPALESLLAVFVGLLMGGMTSNEGA